MNIKQFNNWLTNLEPHPLIMGILNVTPDSFSDGGEFIGPEIAINHSLQMEKDGAHMIDIGGESTRPGAEELSLAEELKRVIPVINGIRKQSDIALSIDTYKSEVAEKSITAGADIINDISGLRFDKKMIDVVIKHSTPIIVMHILGTPKDMQTNPQYNDLMRELIDYFKERISYLGTQGVKKDKIILDPGIGFGKKLEHNYQIIRELNKIVELNCPVLVGPSRKSFIGNVLNVPVNERVEGTAAAVTASIINGARIIRVHDIKEMVKVVRITEKICGIS